MSKKCFLLLFYSFWIAGACILARASDDVMRVKHYELGYTPVIKAYQRDLLQSMLQNTVASFGPYSMELFSVPLSTNRSKLTLQQGDKINILFASEWQGLGVSDQQVLSLELPIYFGFHGLRQLIVHKEDVPVFANINTLDEFKKLTCGQGARWLDVNIYRMNGIDVREGQSFTNLMPMLQKKRFNYLPLSVLETDQVFASRAPDLVDLTVLDDLVIFYPLPSFLFFPISEQRLLDRLQVGFANLEKRGELLALFNSHFSSIPRVVSGQRKRLVMLNNPGLSSEKNQSMKDNFMQKFGAYFDMLK
ncbi:MAG: hypothetical protein RL497_1962 [Pseudomonadota bacterium]|jgi:hypothetical protein